MYTVDLSRLTPANMEILEEIAQAEGIRPGDMALEMLEYMLQGFVQSDPDTQIILTPVGFDQFATGEEVPSG